MKKYMEWATKTAKQEQGGIILVRREDERDAVEAIRSLVGVGPQVKPAARNPDLVVLRVSSGADRLARQALDRAGVLIITPEAARQFGITPLAGDFESLD